LFVLLNINDYRHNNYCNLSSGIGYDDWSTRRRTASVQKDKDRYPLFPELLKHQTAEERLASIANEQETWWQLMRDRHAKLWRKARQALREL
jgi:hypothetical protein